MLVGNRVQTVWNPRNPLPTFRWNIPKGRPVQQPLTKFEIVFLDGAYNYLTKYQILVTPNFQTTGNVARWTPTAAQWAAIRTAAGVNRNVLWFIRGAAPRDISPDVDWYWSDVNAAPFQITR
jgi:hypothetical protein